ncbi:hypothetical protein ACSBR2_020753 [Camellia fascicularis]
MEPAVIRLERRGRKRKRKDVENVLAGPQPNKQVVEIRSMVLVGRYVKKEFEGSGNFFGKIVYYDTGLYRIDYEDGDCEDLESAEVRKLLIRDGDLVGDLIVRKNKLDELLAKKYAKGKDIVDGKVKELVNVADRIKASLPNELSNGDNEIDVQIDDDDADSSSDSCEHTWDHYFSSEADAPFVPPPQLPPSSGNIGVPEECVSHLFSVYGFLRSFSIQLFLSPFGLDDFVGSLNCLVPNTLLDGIHVALMHMLRRHLDMLSYDGSELASKCLRFTDWSLLDTLTWPVYLVQYLMVMGYTNGPEWKGFYIDVLEKDYYTLPAGRKLMILLILCDDVVESIELRTEIDTCEESIVGIDSDAVVSESGPRRVHPRYSKTSACKNEEAMEIIAKVHGTKSTCNSSYLGVKGTEMNVDADIVYDGNGDECRLCGMDGTLLCCDGCPSAYHSRCIGVSKMFIPEGAWYCPECTINKIGPKIMRGTPLRGAEIFGIDSYGQVFLGTCNHLLVLKVSIKSEPCLRYYNQNDISKVLQVLHSSVQHIVLYSEICKGIIQYWNIQKDSLPLLETVEMCKPSANVKEDGDCSTYLAVRENLASSVTESSVENAVVSCPENSCEELVFNKRSLDTMTQAGNPNQQRSGDTTMKHVFLVKSTELIEQTKVDCTMSSGSVIQQADSSDLTHQSFSGKSSLPELATSTSGNSNGSHRGYVDGICVIVNVSSQSKEGNVGSAGRGYRNSSDDCLYMGSHFKSQAYINNYVHGDFAASAAVNLAILSTEESRVSESHSDNRRKLVSANTSLQVKAFSSAAIRFFWPNSEKKLVEVPRERCSWCLSCRAPVTSKEACLLNGAASNAIKGAMKILAGLRPTKNGDGSLLGIATYVILMEESLCGLTIGPFQSAAYRKQWRKQVEQATTCSAVKSLLLELEENIRSVALSGDWVKLVDSWSVESFVTQSATFATGSTQKRGPGGRRGRKPSVISEVTSDDSIDNLSDFNWWRGGILSKLILHTGVLPRSMVKKAARQGGCRKIPGIYYAEGSEIPKRSRQYFWRAAVEMSKNASQLALQVRYLDLHVRWSDLVCPEQNLQDGKGPETEASAFRNAFVCDKKNVEHRIIYGVAFENQKQLPSRVMKNIIEVEQRQDGREKYWFSETHIPLYLIKEYEQDIGKSLLPLAGKPANVLSNVQRRQLKASRKDIFSYLSCKRDNLDKCHCASCQLDVLLGNAVKCSACQGFCHEDCTISSTIQRIGEVEFLITCKRCSPTKTIPKSENSNESSTRPLLLQGQEFQNAVTVSKGAKQKSFIQPSTPVGHLGSFLKIKSAPRGSSLAAKNRHRLCSWGLIWKKKNHEDNGIDFRLKNLLLRGNSDMSWPGPVCHLCHKPYNSDLMYIRCETCKNWYHADAVELEESRIFDLMGFKCCRCRRIRTPVCPYMDPENKRILEAKKPRTRAPKAGNSESDPDYGTISEQAQELESAPPMLPKNEAKRTFSRAPNSESDPGYGIVSEQAKELESAPPGLPNNEEAVCVKEDNPLSSISMAEQFTKLKSEIDVEGNTVTATASGTGPRKLTVRRHIQNENNVDGTSANNLSQVELSTLVEPNHVLIPAEGSCPRVMSDVSESIEDGMLFDHEGLSYEDMEFEPQTYFSFTELLASDDVMGDWQSLSAVSSNGFPEPCGIRPSNQQEHKISVKPSVDLTTCQVCSCTEPCPDLSCHICGVWIHSRCSPWDEQSSSEENWSCGNCREWR